jgi:hypothetical protein
MEVLRCSAKYRKVHGLPARLPEPSPGSSALGDWYANVFYAARRPYFHYTSARSLLGVIVPQRDRNSAEQRFVQRLRELLGDLAIEPRLIDREIHALAPLTYAQARDRSVLGSMCDQVQTARLLLGEYGLSLVEVMHEWARTPYSALEMSSPHEVARELLVEYWSGPRAVT